MSGLIYWIAGLLLSVIGFVAGKAVSETEKVLSEKRRVYEAFLRECMKPTDAIAENARDESEEFSDEVVSLLLYASPQVAFATQNYLNKYTYFVYCMDESEKQLAASVEELSKAHNDLILEMRRDALAWSIFGYRGKRRIEDIPSVPLETHPTP